MGFKFQGPELGKSAKKLASAYQSYPLLTTNQFTFVPSSHRDHYLSLNYLHLLIRTSRRTVYSSVSIPDKNTYRQQRGRRYFSNTFYLITMSLSIYKPLIVVPRFAFNPSLSIYSRWSLTPHRTETSYARCHNHFIILVKLNNIYTLTNILTR